MTRFFRLLVFSWGLAFILIATNNCTGSGSGLSSVAGYCATSSCLASSTSSAASLYLNSQQFTVTKSLDFYGACGGSVTSAWASTSTGVASASPAVITCSDNRTYNNGSLTAYADAVAPFIFRQHYQVSGVCTTGGAAANQITISVIHNNAAPITTDNFGYLYSAYNTTCDSGRFNLVLTPPSCALDPTVYPSGTCGASNATINATLYGQTSPALQLLVTLKTGASLTTLATASQFATTFYVNY